MRVPEREPYEHHMVNHSIEFVNPFERWIHTETIEGFWKHAQDALNKAGGTRDDMIQESIDAWLFRRSFLKTDLNQAFHKLCSCLRQYGNEAREVYPLGQ